MKKLLGLMVCSLSLMGMEKDSISMTAEAKSSDEDLVIKPIEQIATVIDVEAPVSRDSRNSIVIVRSINDLEKAIKEQEEFRQNKEKRYQHKLPSLVYIPTLDTGTIEEKINARKPSQQELEKMVDLAANVTGQDVSKIKEKVVKKFEKIHDSTPSSVEEDTLQDVVRRLRKAQELHKTIAEKKKKAAGKNAAAQRIREPNPRELIEHTKIVDKDEIQQLSKLLYDTLNEKLQETDKSRTRQTTLTAIGGIVASVASVVITYLTTKKTC